MVAIYRRSKADFSEHTSLLWPGPSCDLPFGLIIFSSDRLGFQHVSVFTKRLKPSTGPYEIWTDVANYNNKLIRTYILVPDKRRCILKPYVFNNINLCLLPTRRTYSTDTQSTSWGCREVYMRGHKWSRQRLDSVWTEGYEWVSQASQSHGTLCWTRIFAVHGAQSTLHRNMFCNHYCLSLACYMIAECIQETGKNNGSRLQEWLEESCWNGWGLEWEGWTTFQSWDWDKVVMWSVDWSTVWLAAGCWARVW